VKLAVEEPQSEALLRMLAGRGPYATSVVGEIETARVCRRAGVPPAQVDAVRAGLVIVPLTDEVRRLAEAADPPMLRTLDAVHLASALVLQADLEALVTYDLRLAAAATAVGVPTLAPA
jgi:uncharacterized protein